jgi:DNA-binding CsgD family transcriptional regulator
MAGIDDAAALIRRRLDELEGERGKLEKALAALGGGRNSGAAMPRPKSPGRRKGARRAAKRSAPTRKQQVLAQAKANPTIRTGEIAKALGISPTQVSNLLTRLKKDGALKKNGLSKKWVFPS